VTGINVDLRGAMYKTKTRVPFSHRAVRARLEAATAASAAPADGPSAAGTNSATAAPVSGKQS
jgi:hypothetical protein